MATTGVDTPTFNALWLEISAALVALGLRQGEIDKLKAELCREDDYVEALLDWAKSEEDIKTQLKDIHQIQTTTLEAVDENKSRIEDVHQVVSFSIHNITGPSSIEHVGGLLRLVNSVVFRYVVTKTKKGPSLKVTSTYNIDVCPSTSLQQKFTMSSTCSSVNKMTLVIRRQDCNT